MPDSLRVFWGNFLTTGFSPIELDGNRCDFNCGYCFSNLLKPDRAINAPQVFNLLTELWHEGSKGFKRKTFVANLLRSQFPVTLSNHVDFFSNSNWGITEKVMPIFNAYEIPVILFTKWSPKQERVERFFDFLSQPIGIYTSISTLDESLAAFLEPGAARPRQRLANIRRATELGHVCTVGLNPLCEEWLGDPRPLLNECKEAGVKGILVHELYFSHAKLKNMPAGTRKRIGETAIAYGMQTKTGKANHTYRDDVYRVARDEFGFEVWRAGQSAPSGFWELWYDLYPRRYPMNQDFANHCYQVLKPGDPILFEDWKNFMLPQLPSGTYRLRDHIDGTMKMALIKGHDIKRWMTYEELLKLAWKHYQIPFSPINTMCFQYAVDFVSPNKRIDIVDKNRMPVVVFNPTGTEYDSPWTDQHRL